MLFNFGHVMRHAKTNIFHLALQRKIEGKRGAERRRVFGLKKLRQWFGQITELFSADVDRVKIPNMLANICERNTAL